MGGAKLRRLLFYKTKNVSDAAERIASRVSTAAAGWNGSAAADQLAGLDGGARLPMTREARHRRAKRRKERS